MAEHDITSSTLASGGEGVRQRPRNPERPAAHPAGEEEILLQDGQ
jgi:hypothetical protein